MSPFKQKLHKFLFPSQYERINLLLKERKFDSTRRDELLEAIRELKNKPKPNTADLMRECLKLEPIDFINVSSNPEDPDRGLPEHFLKSADPVLRKTYVAQLAQIYQLEVWHAMTKYHINYQGNYSIRKAETELEVMAGRFSINGIAQLRNDVQKGHDEYVEGSKPKEDYSESDDRRFETTEGVHFKSDNDLPEK